MFTSSLLIGYRYPWLIVVFCIHTYTTHTDWQLPPHFLHYIRCLLMIVVYYIVTPPIVFIYIISRRLSSMFMQLVAVHHIIRLRRIQLFCNKLLLIGYRYPWLIVLFVRILHTLIVNCHSILYTIRCPLLIVVYINPQSPRVLYIPHAPSCNLNPLAISRKRQRYTNNNTWHRQVLSYIIPDGCAALYCVFLYVCCIEHSSSIVIRNPL